MKLTELSPYFIKLQPRGDDRYSWNHVDEIADADGVRFLCPRCFTANGGAMGTHGIICWSPQVPEHLQPGPGRWSLTGTGIDDLSLIAGSSSIQLTGGCLWHGFVRNGEVTDA
ncbi:MAG: hypothetical protein HYX63_13445 [Gammaproteobacteria bacterium]|nr:hypothetical protein [Gammaproteobacteria bacterium]